MAKPNKNRYETLIERIFLNHYRTGLTRLEFERVELETAAQQLKIQLPKNLGDILYSFRYRAELPSKITETAPFGTEWVIMAIGRARYAFVLRTAVRITPNPAMATIKIPDATPGIVAAHSLNDEQALLARIRYNRLIDIFTGLTCYSLQNHLRSAIPDMGQVETDEIYVGIDKRGMQYILPVQAKSVSDRIGSTQIEQDFALCKFRFPALHCRAIAAQFVTEHVIAMFELQLGENELNSIELVAERHYRLVPSNEVTPADLKKYAENPM